MRSGWPFGFAGRSGHGRWQARACRPARIALGCGGEEFGGAGLGYLEHVVAVEELSRASAAVDLGNNMRIVADPNNNALIIMAKAQEYRDIEAVIKQLDVIPLQVLIDATIVEVSLTGSLKYGVQWLFSHADSALAQTSSSDASKVVDAAATAAVHKIKSELVKLLAEHGAAHFQIGKTYLYRDYRDPTALALIEKWKSMVDPQRLVNPQSLGLE